MSSQVASKMARTVKKVMELPNSCSFAASCRKFRPEADGKPCPRVYFLSRTLSQSRNAAVCPALIFMANSLPCGVILNDRADLSRRDAYLKSLLRR